MVTVSTIPSAELLLSQHSPKLSGTAITILKCCAMLDRYGAATWDLRVVGVCTALCLLVVRITCQKKRGIDWYALLHAIVSSTGALACTYIDFFASYHLTPGGITEPERMCQCHGPITSLHRILPAITMGYSLFDVLDGLHLSLDFFLHGGATLIVMAFFVEIGAPNFVTPMLLMEVSTLNLTVVRADFFPPWLSLLNQLIFAFLFFMFRIVIVPYIWSLQMIAMYRELTRPSRSEADGFMLCGSTLLFPLSMAFGIFFNLLNSFWFVKIVLKARRKLTGAEKIHANNDLVESESNHRRKEKNTSNNGKKDD